MTKRLLRCSKNASVLEMIEKNQVAGPDADADTVAAGLEGRTQAEAHEGPEKDDGCCCQGAGEG